MYTKSLFITKHSAQLNYSKLPTGNYSRCHFDVKFFVRVGGEDIPLDPSLESAIVTGQLETVEMENGNIKQKQSKLDANEC